MTQTIIPVFHPRCWLCAPCHAMRRPGRLGRHEPRKGACPDILDRRLQRRCKSRAGGMSRLRDNSTRTHTHALCCCPTYTDTPPPLPLSDATCGGGGVQGGGTMMPAPTTRVIITNDKARLITESWRRRAMGQSRWSPVHPHIRTETPPPHPLLRPSLVLTLVPRFSPIVPVASLSFHNLGSSFVGGGKAGQEHGKVEDEVCRTKEQKNAPGVVFYWAPCPSVRSLLILAHILTSCFPPFFAFLGLIPDRPPPLSLPLLRIEGQHLMARERV